MVRTSSGPLRCRFRRKTRPSAPVAQLDRAPDYESGGREFESSPVRHYLFQHQQGFQRDLIVAEF